MLPRFLPLAMLTVLPSADPGPRVTAAPTEPASSLISHTRVYVNVPVQSLDTYAELATEVVHGRVISTRVEFPENEIARTVYTLEILSAVKGSVRSTQDVCVLGARDDKRWVEVLGAPTFTFGEEIVAFLYQGKDSQRTSLLGLGGGAYHVVVDASGKRTVEGLHACEEPLADFMDRTSDLWLAAELRTR